jgi:L-gulonolactone oxidase
VSQQIVAEWKNWARNVTGEPRHVVHPETVDELVHDITAASQAGRPVKTVGSGHSFTEIAATDGVQISLDQLTGITDVDYDTGLVTVLGGTSLAELNMCLTTHGLALENLGDIDRQTITGAISTGTHGTGATFGGLATQVRALTMITADGSQLRCSAAENPDLFMAARVGLGALGVITEVTLQCLPTFRLQAVEGPARLENVLDGFEDMITENDHVEFYWFPHTDRTHTKRNNRVPHDHVVVAIAGAVSSTMSCSRTAVEGSTTGRLRPPDTPHQSASTRPCAARVHRCLYAVFTSPRRVRFKESEYAVPRAAIAPVLQALRSWIDDHDERICFPVQVRVAAPDDIWLSTAYQRETSYIAVHHYFKVDHRRYFAAFESIAGKGRPHQQDAHPRG